MKNVLKNNFKQILLIISVSIALSCDNDDFTYTDPTANFSVEMNDLEATFKSNTSHAVSLEWDFGDGETSDQINPSHTYAEEGEYTVTLTAVGADGTSNETSSQTISVVKTNPTADFTYEVDNTTITFTNTSERGVSYEWDFGDGQISSEENPVHTYDEPGEYSVTLTVTGTEGTPTASVTNMVSAAVSGPMSITIENADFSLPADGKQSNWENVPGWNSESIANDSGIDNQEENGNWFAYRMSSDPVVYQLTDHTIVSGEEFKVNIEAWNTWNSSQFIVSLYYDDGNGTRNVLATEAFDITDERTVLELTAMATAESVGANLGIMFENVSTDGGDGWSGFDNIALSVEGSGASTDFIQQEIENSDFSLPADGKNQNWENVPGWNTDSVADDSGIDSQEEDGNWFAYRMSSDPAVYQLTEHIIGSSEEFKVNVEAWNTWNSSQFIVIIYYDKGDGTRNVLATETFDITDERTVLELTAMATAESIDANLGIMFENVSTDGGDGWSGFDNVHLFVK
jgi:PKD repeat protein